MLLKFQAVELVAEPEDDDLLTFVWLAAAERRHYLHLSRINALSDDTPIEIERDDQRWSAHSGIRGIRLSAISVHIEFTEATAQTLGGVNEAEIGLKLHADALDRLKQTLINLFRGHDCLRIE